MIVVTGTAIAYLRVSTAGQGQSGLGLEAQHRAVQDLAAQQGLRLLTEFVEIESGKRNDRPKLAEALQNAKLTGSALLIAKLDRLSRNAAFLLTLRDSGVRFVAADLPNANDLTIGVLAVVAQAEREAISSRTRDALAVVKTRIAEGAHVSRRSGRLISRLGNPNGAAALRRTVVPGIGARAATVAADARATGFATLISCLQGGGIAGPSALAAELNRRGILSIRGKRWHPSTVANLVGRLRRNQGNPPTHCGP
jgi:DNA invertase Pin-like site-specific DNA recombinase